MKFLKISSKNCLNKTYSLHITGIFITGFNKKLPNHDPISPRF